MNTLSDQIVTGFINAMLPKPTMTPHPESIPADQFRPMFDTSTDDGKIAVYSRWLKTGEKPWIKRKRNSVDDWDQSDPSWIWSYYDYNYPAEPKRTLVPWTKDTVPREAWLCESNDHLQHRIIGLDSDGIYVIGDSLDIIDVSFDNLKNYWEHSLDGGKTWLPCGTWKEEV